MLGERRALAQRARRSGRVGGGRSTEDARVVPRRQEAELVGMARMALAVEADSVLVDDVDPVHRADREVLDAVVGAREMPPAALAPLGVDVRDVEMDVLHARAPAAGSARAGRLPDGSSARGRASEPAPMPDEAQGVGQAPRDAATGAHRVGPTHGQIADRCALDVERRSTSQPGVRVGRTSCPTHSIAKSSGRELHEPANEALDATDLRATQIGRMEDERPGPRFRHTGSSAIARARYVATRARTAPNVPMAR